MSLRLARYFSRISMHCHFEDRHLSILYRVKKDGGKKPGPNLSASIGEKGKTEEISENKRKMEVKEMKMEEKE